MVVPKTQDHLMKQDASTVDPSKLTALTPEVVRTMFHRFQNVDNETVVGHNNLSANFLVLNVLYLK